MPLPAELSFFARLDAPVPLVMVLSSLLLLSVPPVAPAAAPSLPATVPAVLVGPRLGPAAVEGVAADAVAVVVVVAARDVDAASPPLPEGCGSEEDNDDDCGGGRVALPPAGMDTAGNAEATGTPPGVLVVVAVEEGERYE